MAGSFRPDANSHGLVKLTFGKVGWADETGWDLYINILRASQDTVPVQADTATPAITDAEYGSTETDVMTGSAGVRDVFGVDNVAGALASADVIENWLDGQDKIKLNGTSRIWYKVVWDPEGGRFDVVLYNHERMDDDRDALAVIRGFRPDPGEFTRWMISLPRVQAGSALPLTPHRQGGDGGDVMRGVPNIADVFGVDVTPGTRQQADIIRHFSHSQDRIDLMPFADARSRQSRQYSVAGRSGS